MKLYNRKDFLNLPEGVIFCKGKPWYFEEMSVKGESLPNDFIYLGLQWVEAEGSDEASELLDAMEKTGASGNMQDSWGRDGCFDDDDLFLVYETPDLKRIQKYISNAIKLNNAPNKE